MAKEVARKQIRGKEYSIPKWSLAESKDEAIEACKARVDAGAKCFCKQFCHCRVCQRRNRERGLTTCGPEQVILEGGCELGCNQCSNCEPCW